METDEPAADEDQRALARIQAALLLAAQDPTTIEGWVHPSAGAPAARSDLELENEVRLPLLPNSTMSIQCLLF